MRRKPHMRPLAEASLCAYLGKRLLKHSLAKGVLLIGIYLSATASLLAANFTVSSASQFNALNLSPGDVVTWTDGTYSANQRISFTANGTANNPIILKAETPGGVIFTGETTMDISGDYVIIEGFYWNGGAGTNNHVQFRKGSTYANHSTIRNCAFNNLTPDGTAKHRWVVLYGTNNVVENCSFLNKNSPGALVLVELEYNDFNPVGHQIRNNYFYNYVKRPSGTTHAGDSETIRVGTSEFQNKSASTTVEGNYFHKADGENEIITNKSANNVYRNNTFRRCRGSLVLRHGASATVEGNYFLGENVEGTGGIRISDSYHTITNNYIQDVVSTGDKWNNPITLVGGSATSGGTSNGYQKVDDILVAFNTIYNSESPIFYNDRSSYDPRGVLAYNAIYTTQSNIVTGDISGTGQGMTYTGNIAGGATIGISDTGITSANANFSASGEVFKPSSTGPAANAAGSAYSATVNVDIEGRTRPNSNMDVGAHEVSGGSGTAVNAPITDSQVGTDVGACFVNATGGGITCSGGSSENLSVSSISDFSSSAGSKTATISSNVSWTVTDNQSWISVSPTSGSNNGSISITVTANTGSADRSGTVTVSGGSLTRTLSVTQAGVAANVPVTGVSLSPSTVTVGVGSTAQLSPTVSPSNATDPSVSYSSSNTSVATVDASGLVSGLAAGNATITVTTTDGGFTSTAAVTVAAPSTGTNLALNKSVTTTGTADGSNVGANLVDGSTATRWSSSGFPKSATVDLGAVFSLSSTEVICYNDRAYQYTVEVATTSGGTYTQIVDRSGNTTPGTATSPIIDNFSAVDGRYVRITVSGASGYSGSWVSLIEFRVFGEEANSNVPVTGVSLSPATASLTVGDTQALSATVNPSNATNPSVSYSSSNPSVATVDASGVVSAVAAGSATITVTTADGGFTDTSVITVSNPAPSLPSPWLTTDVGSVAAAGSASLSSGTFSIQGSGSDIWGTADEFRYVYQPISGDVTVTAKVLSVQNTHPWAKSGVMIRESLDAGSKHAITVITPGQGASFQRRVTTNNSSSQTTTPGLSAPYWVRLQRSGNTLTSSVSSDGSTWTTLGSETITLGTNVLVGLAVTSHADGLLCSSSLDNVSVSTLTTTVSNVALNKSVSTTSEQSTNPGTNLVDDNADSRWSASGFPQSAVIDLGSNYEISSTEVICHDDRAYQYVIEAATNSGGPFTQIVNRSSNTTSGTNSSPISDAFSSVTARYVRITVSGASGYSGTWVSLDELRVFGYPAPPSIVTSTASTFSGAQGELALPPHGISLYPNPTTERVTLKGIRDYQTLTVLDPLGRQIIHRPTRGAADTIIDLSAFPSGLYIFKLSGQDHTSIHRVLKE
ncbi:MAG: chondroitinase-B domain-containing protein [Bacteroidota bacterium]